MEALPPFDAVIVTDMSDPQGTYDQLGRRLDADRILPLDVLRITTPPARLTG
jgi:hypothetical protein